MNQPAEAPAATSDTNGPASGADEQTKNAFFQTWNEPEKFPGRLSTVDNIKIGVQFITTAFTFFLVAGAFALIMRVQLAVPENHVLGPQAYNRLFTMHGTTMIYLFAVPFMEGLAALMLPFLLGARDLAYPRLTALSYWVFLSSGLIFFSGYLFDRVADIGWFAYTPLSAPRFATAGIDFWLVGLGAAELAGISAGAELTISVLKLRAPGMSMGRMPLYAWAWLVTAVMVVFAFTTLFMATVLLEADQALGTQFFNEAKGGNHLLWQHLFWFFGHPDVYIIFLPATGIVSVIVVTFAKRVVGYSLIAAAVVLTGFLSFGLWVHHMFATGIPDLALYFFAAASLMVAIGSGVQVFAWIATLWGRRPELKTPLLWVLGFLFIFVLGGLTGVMVAIVPFDLQVHDTYFLVAHFHYVLVGGAVFPMMGGLAYWVPKVSGRLMSEALGKWSFWLAFIGFNVSFFPMHAMGLLGMPRRVYTYPEGLGLGWMNMLSTVGAFMLAAGFGLFVINLFWSLRYGSPTGKNPWGGDTLEWSFESAPTVLFPKIPVVSSRHPMWEPGVRSPDEEEAERITKIMDHRPTEFRATLVVDAITGKPQAIARLATPSYAPLCVASGIILFTMATIFRLYLFSAIGVGISALGIVYWLWPDRKELEAMRTSTLPKEMGLPIFTTGTQSLGWMGMLFAMLVIAWGMTTLLYSYFYLRLYSPQWPQDGLPKPELWLPIAAFAVLPVLAGLGWYARRQMQAGDRWSYRLALTLAVLAPGLFLGLHIFAELRLPFSWDTNAYGSVFYLIEWSLDAVVVVALAIVLTGAVRAWSADPHWQTVQALHAQLAHHFCVFLATLGLVVFGVLYVSPYLLGKP